MLNSSSSISVGEPSDHWPWLILQLLLKYTLIWRDWTVWFCLILLEICFSNLSFLKDVEADGWKKKQMCFFPAVGKSSGWATQRWILLTVATSAVIVSLRPPDTGHQTSFPAARNRSREVVLGWLPFWWVRDFKLSIYEPSSFSLWHSYVCLGVSSTGRASVATGGLHIGSTLSSL